MQAVASGKLDDGIELTPGRQKAGWIVREVHEQRPGLGPDGYGQEIQIQAPTARMHFERPAGDRAPQRLHDRVERLVAGERGDHVVARPQQHVHRYEDQLLRRGDQHLLRQDRPVHPGGLGPEQRMTLGLGVAQLQVVPEGQRFGIRSAEKFIQRQRLAIRRARGRSRTAELVRGEVRPA